MRIVSTLLYCSLTANLAFAGAVPVFYSSEIHPKKREKAFASAGIAGAEFVVYESYSDFEAAVGSKPDVIIAPASFSSPDYEEVLSFSKGGAKTFKYKILSLDAKWNAGNLSGASSGAVAVAGMSDMDGFIKNKAGVGIKMVKTVAKPEDLFPMLVLKSSDVIAMEDYIYAALKDSFGTPATVVTDSKAAGLPGVFVKKGADKGAVKAAYGAIPARVLELVGFDGIQ